MFILLFFKWIDRLQANLITCPSVKYLNMDCPGCGIQRSMIALLKGELLNSIQLYPALLPLLGLLTFTLFHLKYRFSFGTKVIITLQILVAAIVTTQYLYKIFNHQIFH